MESMREESHGFILIGPDFSETEVLERADVSPASAAWIRAFIDILSDIHPVKGSIWYSTQSAWPIGSLIVRTEKLFGSERWRTLAGFINLPKAKRWLVSKALTRELVKRVTREDHVVVYGQNTLTLADIEQVSATAHKLSIIVPDAPAGKRGLRTIQEASASASGATIILPAQLHEQISVGTTLSFQGVVSSKKSTSDLDLSAPKRFVYVGGVDRVGGTHFLLEALKEARYLAKRVTVCGKIADHATADGLRELGVDVLGYVEENRMRQICSEAHAFLNPRDPKMPESSRNFPSKMLLYLGYAKPVISTDTLGMPRLLVSAIGCNGIKNKSQFAAALLAMDDMRSQEFMISVERLNSFVEQNLSPTAVTLSLKQALLADE